MNTDAPKIGSTMHIDTSAAIKPFGHVMVGFGGAPRLFAGRRIHHDIAPVIVSQTSDSANAVLSHKLTGPKSP